ncbi:zonular occludens toxin domain-containing protein [Vandammella animalimorsus]|uniref:zonular occludens toxin domain-containing protein n=1 Tax=Vandammella animalimorsus TaxID=2029117 RepID=UPI001551A8E4|nr:zonular occludens toxin domain-containing protein [Vandammella animalimorsus]
MRERAERENRAVYVCNIPEINIPGWETIAHPDEWLGLPDGALIIVDELQDFWPAAAQGSRVPEAILELSKHGKRGFDFYLITQDPALVHVTPRKLTQTHYHVIRSFGTDACAIHKFAGVEMVPAKAKNRGERTLWRYNKEAYGWYKSADVHNVKRQIPRKLWAIPAMLLLLVLCIGLAVWGIRWTIARAKTGDDPAAALVESGPGAAHISSGPVQRRGDTGREAPMTRDELLASLTPRLTDWPHTAPRYDELTRPVDAPRLAACIDMRGKCTCYTQQGTLVPSVSQSTCRQVVKYGYFDDWSGSGGGSKRSRRGDDDAAGEGSPSSRRGEG